ncbi:hypothetical protein A9Q74_03760 [Colwellia sp. 39_35_sub15_T18]|nr:hypothetical protein A9Q74_03760 [Colwellia sp. 39_35_sub15_T18]
MKNRVVITGSGIVSSIGLGIDAFKKSIFNGVNGISRITRFDSDKVNCKSAAEVKNFDFSAFNIQSSGFYDRYSQFGIVSAKEALSNANLTIGETYDIERTAVVFGTGIGGIETQEKGYEKLFIQNGKRLHPFTVPKAIPSAAASLISLELGITGPCFGVTSACSSSGHAIIQSYYMLASGLVDMVITGGAEAPISYGVVKAWEGMRVLASDYCRPFSHKRGGTILGEGGGTLVLETLDAALERNAPILAEIVGVGMSSDAFHPVKPHLEGPIRSMNQAINHAGIRNNVINYINAHGTGTHLNDMNETLAIKSVFDTNAHKIAVSSTKSMHGHTLGASSAVEAIATILSLNHQVIPPTINFVPGDDVCDLDYVPNHSRASQIDFALCNSFAFGGLNTSILFKSYY